MLANNDLGPSDAFGPQRLFATKSFLGIQNILVPKFAVSHCLLKNCLLQYPLVPDHLAQDKPD